MVHVGCGPGYYTAVMAEVVGNQGHVTSVEIDSRLAARARTLSVRPDRLQRWKSTPNSLDGHESNLSHLAQVKIIEGDGGEENPGPCDAILVNAGATHPRSIWLDSLRPADDSFFR